MKVYKKLIVLVLTMLIIYFTGVFLVEMYGLEAYLVGMMSYLVTDRLTKG